MQAVDESKQQPTRTSSDVHSSSAQWTVQSGSCLEEQVLRLISAMHSSCATALSIMEAD